MTEEELLESGIKVGDILPTFNATDRRFRITGFDGWFTVAAPDTVLVASGGPGAVAVGEWAPLEAYYTLAGVISATSRPELLALRGYLLAALPAHADAPIEVLSEQKQIFVRRYDRPDVAVAENTLSFTFPLVASDPFKYSIDALDGTVGVFTGQRWFRTYTDNSGDWVRSYDTAGDRTYEQAFPTGPYPQSLTLTSDGDASSQRVTVEVTGPLTAGDWWLWNETTGSRLWVEAGVTADQTLTLDNVARTATLNGADVGHLVFGDWLTLEPGANVFRLVAGTDSAAFAHITALEAWQ